MADTFNGAVPHLNARDATFTCISRAPLGKLQAYKRRMGWSFPWASSYQSDYNFDLEISRPKETARAVDAPPRRVRQPVTCAEAGATGLASPQPGRVPGTDQGELVAGLATSDGESKPGHRGRPATANAPRYTASRRRKRTEHPIATEADAGPFPRIQFTDARHGFLVPAGRQGKVRQAVYSTSDVGRTWTFIRPDIPFTQPGITFEFVTVSAGFAWTSGTYV